MASRKCGIEVAADAVVDMNEATSPAVDVRGAGNTEAEVSRPKRPTKPWKATNRRGKCRKSGRRCKWKQTDSEDQDELEMKDCIERYEEENKEMKADTTNDESEDNIKEKIEKTKENNGKTTDKQDYNEVMERLRERGKGYLEAFT